MFQKFIVTAIVLILGGSAGSQDLRQYIDEGLKSNLVLQQKATGLEKSLLAIREARSLYLPTTWVEGQYTLANGGRSIDIPVGDLLNPVYKTLNQLTGENKFPQISNVSEQFLPNNFYDLRLRTTMPIVNPDLKYNKLISEEQSILQKHEVMIYKRELVKEIKSAYYNYVLSLKAISIHENALEVVKQNLRVNQSLLENGKGLPAYVSRAESEVQKVEKDLRIAFANSVNAKAYFNFLLNRPLSDSISFVDSATEDLSRIVAAVTPTSSNQREELESIKTEKEITGYAGRMYKSYRTPRLNAFLDLGSQGFDFRVNDNSLFYLGGLQVQLPMFSGRRNIYKIRQNEIDAKAVEMKLNNATQQLELAAVTSRNNFLSAYNSFKSAEKQQQAAQQYFKLIDKGYKEGVNSFLEYLDARNQFTNSQLSRNIDYYKVWIAYADYERQTASYSFQ
jgi:outer membrane protein